LRQADHRGSGGTRGRASRPTATLDAAQSARRPKAAQAVARAEATTGALLLALGLDAQPYVVVAPAMWDAREAELSPRTVDLSGSRCAHLCGARSLILCDPRPGAASRRYHGRWATPVGMMALEARSGRIRYSAVRLGVQRSRSCEALGQTLRRAELWKHRVSRGATGSDSRMIAAAFGCPRDPHTSWPGTASSVERATLHQSGKRWPDRHRGCLQRGGTMTDCLQRLVWTLAIRMAAN